MLFESMREDARYAIVNALEDGYEGYGADFHNAIFNMDAPFSDRSGESELEECGVFAAIKYVMDYEKSVFGEVYTDFSNPAKVANMLWYIMGEEELATMFEGYPEWDEWWNEEIGETECKVLLAWLKDHGRI